MASLEEAGEELLTVYRYPRSQRKGLRTTNAIERLSLEFRRRIKIQGSLPGEAAVLALLYGLLASGQIRFRKLDGWQDMAVALTTAAKTDKAASRPMVPEMARAHLAYTPRSRARQYSAIPRVRAVCDNAAARPSSPRSFFHITRDPTINDFEADYRSGAPQDWNMQLPGEVRSTPPSARPLWRGLSG